MAKWIYIVLIAIANTKNKRKTVFVNYCPKLAICCVRVKKRIMFWDTIGYCAEHKIGLWSMFSLDHLWNWLWILDHALIWIHIKIERLVCYLFSKTVCFSCFSYYGDLTKIVKKHYYQMSIICSKNLYEQN